MTPTPNRLEVFAETRAQWRAWLEANHASASGVWLVFNKKSSGLPHVSYEEGVEEALCFGWVDSKGGKVDEVRSSLYYAPRNPKSGWSRPNKERVARLLEAGLMTEAGLAKIETAKQNGSWTLLDAVENLEIPADLDIALKAVPLATENFVAFPRSARRGILEWIAQAKRPETRAVRIAETARLAALGKRANQWRE
jgi:uncharacterized protein YdeI (YjbR/CyaY-like superfamily)